MIFLQFYLQCPKCGLSDKGKPDGEWLGYIELCDQCDVPMIPIITVKPKEH